jgi:hypothetical protein
MNKISVDGVALSVRTYILDWRFPRTIKFLADGLVWFDATTEKCRHCPTCSARCRQTAEALESHRVDFIRDDEGNFLIEGFTLEPTRENLKNWIESFFTETRADPRSELAQG